MMRSPRRFVLAGCLVAMSLASSAVQAGGEGTLGGGTITFVGSVVEPTCSVAAMSDELNRMVNAAQAHELLQRNCAAPARAAVSVSRPYAVSVTQLSASEPDHVLEYFAHYVRAAEPSVAHPLLVTQTYE